MLLGTQGDGDITDGHFSFPPSPVGSSRCIQLCTALLSASSLMAWGLRAAGQMFAGGRVGLSTRISEAAVTEKETAVAYISSWESTPDIFIVNLSKLKRVRAFCLQNNLPGYIHKSVML